MSDMQSEPTFADTLQAMMDAAYQRGWDDHAAVTDPTSPTSIPGEVVAPALEAKDG